MAKITDTSGYGRANIQRGYKPPAPRVARTNYSALENYKARRHQKQMQQAQREDAESARRRSYLLAVATPNEMPPDLQRKYDELKNTMYEDAENNASEESLIRQMQELNALNQAAKVITDKDKEIRTGVYGGGVYTTDSYEDIWEDDGSDFNWRERAAEYRDRMFSESAKVPDTNVIAEKTQGFIDNILEGGENIEVGRVLANGLLEYNKTRRVPEELKEALLGQIYTSDPAITRYYQKRYGDNGFNEFIEDVLPKLNTQKSEAFVSRFSTPRGGDDEETSFLDPEARKGESGTGLTGVTAITNAVDMPRGMKMTIDVDGVSTNGEISQIRYDKDGNEVADITYSINTGSIDDRTGQPRTQLKTETILLEDALSNIKSTGTEKQYKAAKDRVEELRKSGKESQLSFDLDAIMAASNKDEVYESGEYDGKNKGSVSIVRLLESENIPFSNVDYDPTGFNDISFSVNEVEYSYDFGSSDDRNKFKEDLKNRFGTKEVEKPKEDEPKEGGIFVDEDGNEYEIPAELVDDFLKDNPKARRVNE